MILIFFFFQAEDGIRDGHVTGVQTCALPISDEHRVVLRAAREHLDDPTDLGVAADHRVELALASEIGRASCRERVYIEVSGVIQVDYDEKNIKVQSREVDISKSYRLLTRPSV